MVVDGLSLVHVLGICQDDVAWPKGLCMFIGMIW